MGNKLYFWVLLAIFISLGFLIQVQDANAMTAAEIEPGIVELSTTNIYGFEIVDSASKNIRGKDWVYFCIREKKTHKNKKDRCFYGRKQDFSEAKTGLVLNGIQFGLKNRIHNSKGYIPLRKNAYFYPVRIIRPQYVTLQTSN